MIEVSNVNDLGDEQSELIFKLHRCRFGRGLVASRWLCGCSRLGRLHPSHLDPSARLYVHPQCGETVWLCQGEATKSLAVSSNR